MRAFALLLAIGILLIGFGVPVILSVVLTIAPIVAAILVPRERVRCTAQPVALRALVLFRAPPSLA
ncbi:MAG TPA: hypothetical protein VNI54_08340 [Thermoanaerobaculia bacterium]|nr:hypothetical protein [Thermoanaerobaculia bacterium]